MQFEQIEPHNTLYLYCQYITIQTPLKTEVAKMKPNLKYRIARPEDLPVIKKHLQEYFWGHDPTTKVLGINKVRNIY